MMKQDMTPHTQLASEAMKSNLRGLQLVQQLQQLLGELPLGLGQGGTGVLVFQVRQQFPGTFALLLKVEATVGSGG